jgi:hypothetical protein
MGTVVSALGIYLSVKLDLPTGRDHGVHVRAGALLMAAVRPLIVRRGGRLSRGLSSRRRAGHLFRDGERGGQSRGIDAHQVDQAGQAAAWTPPRSRNRGRPGRDPGASDGCPPCPDRGPRPRARERGGARRSRRRRACSRPRGSRGARSGRYSGVGPEAQAALEPHHRVDAQAHVPGTGYTSATRCSPWTSGTEK